MVMALQTRLANMSSNFQQVLEVRTENLKQQKTRREQVKNEILECLSVGPYVFVCETKKFSGKK